MLFFILIFIGYVFSDEIEKFSFFGPDVFDPYYEFDNNNIRFTSFAVDLPQNDIEIRTTYESTLINGAYYITINHTPVIKALLLYNDDFGYISIYDPVHTESGLLIRHDLPNRIRVNRHDNFHNLYNIEIKASSFLIENNIRYTADNLRMSIKDGPWVEGVSGDGIGEFIEIDYKTDIKEINGIVISNGFVSVNNPDLFLKNNRVKKILIEGDDGRFRNEYEILDTPNLQTIHFPISISKIKITILDIYKGTTWDDTCINMIIGIKL
jgi:hypothetical protein